MTLAGYRSPSDDVGSGAQRDWTNSCSLNGVNRTWARVQGSRGLRALAYQSDPICNLVSPAPKVARVGGGSSSRTAHFSPKNVGHLSLITRQSAALNHSMIPVPRVDWQWQSIRGTGMEFDSWGAPRSSEPSWLG